MLMDTLKTLCALDGVSGCEDQVRAYCKEQAAPYADEMRVDALGNLIVFKKGTKSTGNKLLLAAHMDEVGMIVRSITEDGDLKFSCVGGIDQKVLLGKPVTVGEAKVPGVIGVKPIHLLSSEERKSIPKVDNMTIDIGAKDKDEAQKKVAVGDYVSFAGDIVEFGDGFIKAKAIDDRLGCAVMLELLKEDLPMDCTFAFTVQEEIGCKGAMAAAFSVTPEIALILETTTATDLAGVKGEKQVCCPGQGPVVPFMDSGSVADRGLYELSRTLAEHNNIPWQTKHMIAGGNDARAIQRSKAGVRTVVMSAAVRYLHAPSTVACIRDFEDILKLARLFIGAVANEEV